LEDVRLQGHQLTVSPLKAITPEEAEDLAERLYGMLPRIRVTALLAETHRWTGFADAFAHFQSGHPDADPRVVLTAVLADAINLGLSRMADACNVACYRTRLEERRKAGGPESCATPRPAEEAGGGSSGRQ
jgi:hypothetical protein